MRVFSLCCVLFILAAASAAADRPRVVASIEPLAMMARQLLDDTATVETLLRPAQNLHSASLTPGQARAIRDADTFLWLGAEAEPQLAPLVRRRTGTTLALLAQPGVLRLGGRHAHEHDGQGDGETTLDPHLWLAPENIRVLARALADATGVTAEGFREELDAAVARVRERLAPLREAAWLSHHDPWAYFYHAFPLRQPLTISEGSPRGASSQRLVTLARAMESQHVHCAIAEPEARRALLERLCRDQCDIVAVDPLGRDQAGAGYTAFLEETAGRFARCLGEP